MKKKIKKFDEEIIRDPKILAEICKYCGIRRGLHSTRDKCPTGKMFFKKDNSNGKND